MELVHFTELKDLAERTRIERGAKYVHCHDLRERDDYYPGDDPMPRDAYCYDEVAASGLERRLDTQREAWQYAVYYGHAGKKLLWHFASDSGLWEVLGIEYKNTTNYLLNVNQLLRKGIVIDRTPIRTSLPPAHR